MMLSSAIMSFTSTTTVLLHCSNSSTTTSTSKLSSLTPFSTTRRVRTTSSLNQTFFRNNKLLYANGGNRNLNSIRRRRPISPIFMEWQDCTVKMDIDVPVSTAYNCYLDREAIPRWMPFISTVKVLEDKPDLSRWSLKYKAFGQDIEFSWLARNMQPIPNQKIHWRSLEGLPNRGVVRFFPKSPTSCTVELTVSYEIPQILTPVSSALKPLLENLLVRGLERFTKVAKTYT
ncbi:hypothetical protein C5167_014921 [Papaver somniferum]|uniref:Coenzyme Q-binding protein COQ10 START domain-containing protein n=1 Tax=Papaver somniferum TaxID=3469 RepID=A0A4Y7J7P3_PAPSO|nr:uncharacterized protein LOC113357970 [Papaver somniferum]RZC56070.1 hypothetical protein C5167_014921 [Papaver somniferum]